MIIDNNDDEYSFHNDPREPDHDSEIDSRAFLQRWKNRREVHRRQWVLAVHWENWEPLRWPLVRGDLCIQLQITIFNYINRSHYLHICNAFAVYYNFPRCGSLVEQSSRIPMFTKSSMTTTWHSSHHTLATGSHQKQIRIQFFGTDFEHSTLQVQARSLCLQLSSPVSPHKQSGWGEFVTLGKITTYIYCYIDLLTT